MQNPYKEYLARKPETSVTQRRFIRAMQELLEGGREFNKISVSELCRAAGLSRTMFYKTYQNLTDVIDDMQDCFLYDGSEISVRFYKLLSNPDDIKQSLRAFMKYMIANKKSYYCFLRSDDGQYKRFVEKWKGVIKYRFFDYYADRSDSAFILEVVSSALVGGLLYFVDNHNKYPEKQFEESLLYLYSVIKSY